MADTIVPTTELDAVNALLQHIGEAKVSSLEDLALDAADARDTLARVNREVQTRGWYWNRSKVKLKRTNNKEFLIPTNCVRIDTTDQHAHIEVIQRGGKLIDRRPYKNTSKFEDHAELCVEMVQLYPFEELPEAARQYIYIRAGRQFQEFNLGSSSISRFTEDDEKHALVAVMQDEMTTGDYNLREQGPSAARFPAGFRSF